MRKLGFSLLLVLGLMTSLANTVRAQSVAVTPTNGYVPINGTVQYMATVTGLSSNAVTWSAGGHIGGSVTAGTINSSGLYTAPASLPGQNPVMITATSTVNSAISGTTYVNIESLGPNITAVSPNPLNPGTITVTVTGSTFVTGAEVYISYGSQSGVQMSTTNVSSNSVTATGYLGPSTSATFQVKNPGSALSNSITIPVVSTTKYTLTVVNGSGSGTYASGTVVTITANPPPMGQSFVDWTGAVVANPNASATTITMPDGNRTVAANYSGGSATTYSLTVVNGSGSGSYTAGSVVTITANPAPPNSVFLDWTGAAVTNPNASPTTLTMPAANTIVTANYTSPPVNIPYPVSTHPRLWITVNDLPHLTLWANKTNPIYANGMVSTLAQALNVYNTKFLPNGVLTPNTPNANYPDPGDTQGYTGYLTEQYGIILAFNSLIDPSKANRITYAQDARNMLMYAMDQAVQGHLANAPFRDPEFAVYNRANGSGEQWPLMVNWLYNAVNAQGQPILAAADKLAIRNVFLIWANDCVNAETTGGDSPPVHGVTNSPQLLPGNQPYRMASNNYYLGHARLLTMMALSIDPGDDPPLNSAAPNSQLGNTLRSYILEANGAWLYEMFAMMADPATVAAAYGIPNTGSGFGLSSGGLPPEGMLYGHSFAYVLGQLLALQTAGFNSVSNSGPQIGLMGAPVWDRYVKGMFSSITPTPMVPPTESYLGPIYQYAGYGDMLRTWCTPDFMQPFALLALLDGENGSTAHANAARWFCVNGVEGGANALYTHITDPWSWSSTQSILYYMLMDPSAATPTDPRPTYPTLFYDAPAARIVAHSDWSSTNTMFDYKASWESMNHQDGTAGQFELYRNGEWLTKEMSNYDNNGVGLTTVYHNTLALQNTCPDGTPKNLQWWETGEWANGSQFILGQSLGDPVTVMSSGSGYVYAATDMTKLYNRPDVWSAPDASLAVTQATRSILWLNNDYIVTYDRATTTQAGLFKRYNLCLVTNPAIAGSTATETMASGQKLFMQTLLPASPSITAAFDAANLNPIAELESTRYVLTIQDPTNPADTRFLHVLQGANPGVSMTVATRLQSSSGTAFDGAAFGSTAVYFPVSANGAFVTTAFSVPAAVHTLLVTGLAPNGSYTVSVQSGRITVTPGGGSSGADAAGLLRVTF